MGLLERGGLFTKSELNDINSFFSSVQFSSVQLLPRVKLWLKSELDDINNFFSVQFSSALTPYSAKSTILRVRFSSSTQV